MSIQVINLTKTYGSQKALNDVNLQVKDQRTTMLLGPNGAGKSTLMKCLTDIITYDEGEIFINELLQKEYAFQLKKIIGYLPENNPLYPEMYVKEYLLFVADIFKISKDEVERVIEKVGLTPERRKKIKQLSKGYKQRVGLAQAILNDPKYLILDEPTNGLDPNQILEIRKLIKELSQEKTVILSTHIMQEVEALGDDVILINQGKIQMQGSLEAFKNQYSSLEEAFYQYTQ